jgi:F420H(2)-dependent quinone reductase
MGAYRTLVARLGHQRWFAVMLRQLGGSRVDPRVTVRLGADTAPYRGRPAAADELERYWPALLEAWPAHATYRERSGVRHLFVLEPVRAAP